MTLQHLDAIVAFIAVMLAASLVITAGTQVVISFLGLRGSNLRRSLADLFETASEDRDAKRYAKEISRRVLRHPLISNSILSRSSIRVDELPFIPAEAAGKLRWAASEIPFQPWLLGALSGCFTWPLTLMTIKYLLFPDFCAYSTIIASYVPIISLCEHPWRSGAILGAVIGGLLSRWRLSTSIRVEELIPVLEKLSAPPGGTLPDPAQRAMLVMAGEAQSRPHSKINAVSATSDKFIDDIPDLDGGSVAVAVEKKVVQTSGEAKPRLETLASCFDYVMERASQRFTTQARVVTVMLTVVLVFGMHLDAIRLFQTLSSDAQLRVQLGATADAMIRQAEQFSRTREGAGYQASREAGRTVVPEVYRAALINVLQPVPENAEQLKPKSRHASRSIPPPSSSSPEPQAGVAAEMLTSIQDSTRGAAGEGDRTEPAVALATPEAPAKKQRGKAGASKKSKTSSTEREKSVTSVLPGEDNATIKAKARATKALAARPGFASRDDAVLWLHSTLDGDPALENIVAAYEQEVNAQLVSDADKLSDHSASLERELARSKFQLLPEKWPGWKPTGNELPGLLVAVAFLSLCAPLCYNVLKNIASLRPPPVTKRG